MSDVESSEDNGLTCDNDKVQCVGMASFLVYPAERRQNRKFGGKPAPPLPNIATSWTR